MAKGRKSEKSAGKSAEKRAQEKAKQAEKKAERKQRAVSREREINASMTQRLIEAMETARDQRGKKRWIIPWFQDPDFRWPINGVTGKPYGGKNVFKLLCDMERRGIRDHRFAGYRQAQDRGHPVQRGSKGYKIAMVFDSRRQASESADNAAGGPAGRREDGSEVPRGEAGERIREERERRRFFVVWKDVFNFADMEGAPPLVAPEVRSQEQIEDRATRLIGRFCETERVKLLRDGDRGVKVQAYYHPRRDEIHVPPSSKFRNPLSEMGTILHEMVHSTGHESRLSREGITGGAEKGSATYAFEELVAEIGALLTLGQLGIEVDDEHMANHAVYVDSWIRLLKSDEKALEKSFRLAEAASKRIMLLDPEYVAVMDAVDATPRADVKKEALAIQSRKRAEREYPAEAAGRDSESASGEPVQEPALQKKRGRPGEQMSLDI